MKRVASSLVSSLCLLLGLAACGTSSDGADPVEVRASRTSGRLSDAPLVVPPSSILPTEQKPTGTTPMMVDAHFEVTSDGAATYSIPLWSPAGRAGVEPRLSLAYHSRADNGLLGVGWELKGFSRISRCRKTFAQDGSAAPIRFQSTDGFCLDGQRLTVISSSAGLIEFRTEVESFTRVLAYLDGTGAPDYFEAHQKDGRILAYGRYADTRSRLEGERLTVSAHPVTGITTQGVESTSVRLTWALSEIRDRAGNDLRIRYLMEGSATTGYEHVPERIDYTGHSSDPTGAMRRRSVRFTYDAATRPDAMVRYVSGLKLRESKRLSRIEMHGPGLASTPTTRDDVLLRSFDLSYRLARVTRRSLLERVWECDGLGVCRDALEFDYSPGLDCRASPDNDCDDPVVTLQDFEVKTAVEWQGSTLVPIRDVKTRGDPVQTAGGTLIQGVQDFWTLHTLDIDGDGRDDLLYRRNDTAKVVTDTSGSRIELGDSIWYYRLAIGVGVYGPATRAHLPDSKVGNSDDDLRIADMNGDGIPEVISVERADWTGTHGKFQLYSFDGTKFVPAGIEAPEIQQFWWQTVSSSRSRIPVMHVADFDGDGLPELFRSTQSPQAYTWAYRKNLGGLSLSTYMQIPFSSGIDHAGYAADVDGDGTTEVLIRSGGHSTSDLYSSEYFAVGLGAGGGHRVSSTALPAVPIASGPNTGARNIYNRTWFLDVNGDGLADAVSTRREREADSGDEFAGDVSIAINTGNGFLPPIWQDLAPQHELSPSWIQPTQRGLDPGVRILDFDRDGRQDLLLTDSGATNDNGATRTKMWVLLARDDHFEPRELDVPVGQSTGGTSNSELLGYGQRFSQVLDANGDGLADIIHMEDDPSIQNSYRRNYGLLKLYIRQGELPDALTSVRVGKHGRSVAVRYQHFLQQAEEAGQPPVYTAGTCTYPQQCPSNMWVVVESGLDDGTQRNQFNTLYYAYEAARVDVQGRGWLGFAKRTVINSRTNARTVTTYDNQTRDGGLYLRAGMPVTETTEVTLESGVRHQHKRVFEYTVGTSPAQRPFLYSSLVTDEYREGTGTTLPLVRRNRQTRANDAYGNDTATETFSDEVVSGVLSGRSWSTKREVPLIDNLTSTWLIGLPRRVVNTSATADGLVRSRVETHDYNIRGLLTRTVVEPAGSADELLTTTYGRNAFGLVERLELAGSGMTRVETSQLDPIEHMFVVTTFNAAGHRGRAAYHPGLGTPLVVEDANGLLTYHQRDGFGRLRRTVSPSGETVLISHGMDALGWMRITTRKVGSQEVSTTLDNHGREFRRETRGFDGRVITLLSEYNDLGQKMRMSRPFSGTAPARYLVATYDLLGRRLTLSAPEGGTVTQIYSELTTTTLDERGDKTTQVANAVGQVVASSAYDATGREIRTTYEYGPFGVLRRVTDSQGNVVSIEHDVRGRRTKVTDPDSGVSTVSFNAFGEPRIETDGNGSQTIFETYDALGRQVRVTTQDGAYTHEWDTELKGALTNSTSPDGVTVSHLYNGQGLLAQSTWTIEGTVYTVNRTYDTNGRLATLLYPQVGARRFSLVHAYTDYGFLKDVRAPSATKAFWTAQAHDDFGQVTSEQLGNDVVTERRHDLRGRLRFIDSRRAGTALQGLAYEWDMEGNLKSRADMLARTTEDFEYDTLDRLTKWTVFQNCRRSALEYRYDDLGNLLERRVLEGVGTATTSIYTGAGAGPHAVKQTLQGSYGYDANGNQVSGPGRAVSYTAFDLPRQITGPGREVSFKYDGGQSRVLKRSSLGGVTTYVGSLYEKRQQGGQTQHIFYVTGGGRPVAQVHWVDGSADQTLYLLGDHLGSTERVVDALGNVLDGERMKFEPFGDGRLPHALPVAASVGAGAVTKGFTGHESDDEFGLVNMGGRIYDPETARFLTPDPVVQFPHDGQSYNRYAYTLNNPLRWTDPTGFEADGGDLPPGGETIVTAPRYENAPIYVEQGIGAAQWGVLPADASQSADQNGAQARAQSAENQRLVRERAMRGSLRPLVDSPTLPVFLGTEHERQMAVFEDVRKASGEVLVWGMEFVAVELLTRGVGWIAGSAFRAAIIDGALTLRAAGRGTAGTLDGVLLGGGCFVSGTPVLTSSGPLAIEDVREGDWVWAWDEKTQVSGWHQVTRTFVRPMRAVLMVELSSGDAESFDVLGVTAEHPFWVSGRGWVEAQSLMPGDALETATGNRVLVTSLQSVPGRETVYNFEVDGAHTYFVGELSTWVHNTSVSGLGGQVLGVVAATAAKPVVPIIGHATPWAAMTQAEKNAFKHSYSRHGAELGLPNWSEKNAAKLQQQFNSVVGHIRATGTQLAGPIYKPWNGQSVKVNFFESTLHGTKYYYYEDTVSGRFISAGLAR
ncbi:polymorphic toxin-type HINT domain-containing protein [Myxococcus sp. AS-1-15]|uniref:polymorphic toxin-type HINT domain-containing protein n=1 Tax=Myxococcus sp. AS-1-15 TaxID=2874600 RepID=UPI001CBEAE42|nr:polymorphic toxin-type HINT domain-containing protein [Myxococcus sp. AS-1-15]MBZ4396818.1 FG-GAP-like repeat-containing protein [Myxococcus sp. AS-1-15]